jgi:hypothetical protein
MLHPPAGSAEEAGLHWGKSPWRVNTGGGAKLSLAHVHASRQGFLGTSPAPCAPAGSSIQGQLLHYYIGQERA